MSSSSFWVLVMLTSLSPHLVISPKRPRFQLISTEIGAPTVHVVRFTALTRPRVPKYSASSAGPAFGAAHSRARAARLCSPLTLHPGRQTCAADRRDGRRGNARLQKSKPTSAVGCPRHKARASSVIPGALHLNAPFPYISATFASYIPFPHFRVLYLCRRRSGHNLDLKTLPRSTRRLFSWCHRILPPVSPSPSSRPPPRVVGVRSFLRSGRVVAARRSHAMGRGRTRYGRPGRMVGWRRVATGARMARKQRDGMESYAPAHAFPLSPRREDGLRVVPSVHQDATMPFGPLRIPSQPTWPTAPTPPT
jgi:hypothetical protein